MNGIRYREYSSISWKVQGSGRRKHILLITTVPVNGLTRLSIRKSAGMLIVKFRPCICTGRYLKLEIHPTLYKLSETLSKKKWRMHIYNRGKHIDVDGLYVNTLSDIFETRLSLLSTIHDFILTTQSYITHGFIVVQNKNAYCNTIIFCVSHYVHTVFTCMCSKDNSSTCTLVPSNL